MKRQRAESLAERELSLLPLIGHRRAEDLGGRVQVEFNLVAGFRRVVCVQAAVRRFAGGIP